jgi:pimeloyl-ACP methyl ester carboxylesterase
VRLAQVAEVEVVPTSAGPVEIARIPGEKLPVLFFPGGHCSARSDCGWSLYTQSGHGVMSFSRPGYGATRVGAVTAAEFAPVVRDVCRQLNVGPIAAAVGVSFGGLQAVHVAGDRALAVPRLILHSCAPSVLPYPDTRSETVAGPLMFSPVLQGILWRLVRRMVRSESGLRRMMAHLSRLPVDEWWGELTAADKDDARALFEAMESGSGFVYDLRQGRRRQTPHRLEALLGVSCPTLVTGSPYDGGVSFAHAKNLADVIPGAVLAELHSPTHLFWIGPSKAPLDSLVSSFISE